MNFSAKHLERWKFRVSWLYTMLIKNGILLYGAVHKNASPFSHMK